MNYNREKFEDVLYQKRFIAAVSADLKLDPFMPTKEQFLAKDADGNYVDEYVAAMWFSWKLAIDILPLNPN